jgi:hypothetical protein
VADFTRLAATAERLIEKNGRTVTVTKQGKTPTDSTKPWRGLSTPGVASVTGKAVFVEPSKLQRNEDNVKRAEQGVYFAANNDGGQALETFDTLLDGASTWKILSAELLKPASKKLLYIFAVAR